MDRSSLTPQRRPAGCNSRIPRQRYERISDISGAGRSPGASRRQRIAACRSRSLTRRRAIGIGGARRWRGRAPEDSAKAGPLRPQSGRGVYCLKGCLPESLFWIPGSDSVDTQPQSSDPALLAESDSQAIFSRLLTGRGSVRSRTSVVDGRFYAAVGAGANCWPRLRRHRSVTSPNRRPAKAPRVAMLVGFGDAGVSGRSAFSSISTV
jgi:hypothetical protein